MGSLIPLFLVALRFDGSNLSDSVGGIGAIASGVPAAMLWPCLAWSTVIAASRLYMGVRPKQDEDWRRVAWLATICCDSVVG